MPIDLHAIYTLKENVLRATFDTAGILFDLRSRRCLELNRTGIEIVDHLNGREPLGLIIARMATVYGHPRALVQKDLESFIAILQERDLLDERHASPYSSQG
jgi:hypothetical protein